MVKKMNKKIKEIANKCYSNPVPFRTHGEFDQEKFANLIINECIDRCDEVDSINKYHIEYDFIDPQWGPKECIEIIKNHFGIVE